MFVVTHAATAPTTAPAATSPIAGPPAPSSRPRRRVRRDMLRRQPRQPVQPAHRLTQTLVQPLPDRSAGKITSGHGRSHAYPVTPSALRSASRSSPSAKSRRHHKAPRQRMVFPARALSCSPRGDRCIQPSRSSSVVWPSGTVCRPLPTMSGGSASPAIFVLFSAHPPAHIVAD